MSRTDGVPAAGSTGCRGVPAAGSSSGCVLGQGESRPASSHCESKFVAVMTATAKQKHRLLSKWLCNASSKFVFDPACTSNTSNIGSAGVRPAAQWRWAAGATSDLFIGGAAFTLERPNGSTLGSKGIETRAKTKDTHRDVRLHRDKVTETKHTQRDTLACK